MKGRLNEDFTEEDVYSFEEIKTNKVFIDKNKKRHTIYRKMVDLGTLPKANQVKEIAHNIQNLDMWIIVGGVFYNSNKEGSTLPSTSPNIEFIEYQTMIDFNKTTVQVSSGVDRSEFTGHVIIEYTKTTD